MKLRMKRRIAMVVVTLALTVVAGLAQAAETRFAVQDAAGTTDKMVVTDTGLIGIGTTTPAAAIHAKGNAVNSQFRAHFNGLTANGGGTFVMLHNNGSVNALPTALNRVGAMYFGTEAINPANNLPGSYYGAGITIIAENDWSVTPGPLGTNGLPTSVVVAPSYITIDTATGTEARAERLKISGKGIAVRGGVQITPRGVKTCDVNARGTFWVTQGATNVADVVEVCVKQADNTYAWKALF